MIVIDAPRSKLPGLPALSAFARRGVARSRLLLVLAVVLLVVAWTVLLSNASHTGASAPKTACNATCYH